MFIRAHREKTQSSCRERRHSIGLLKSRSKVREKNRDHNDAGRGWTETEETRTFIVSYPSVGTIKIYWSRISRYPPAITLILSCFTARDRVDTSTNNYY